MAAMKILVGVFAFVCLYVSTTESMYYPPKGSWGPWGSWCKCSKLCGGGDQYRTRKCSYAPCVGKARQTRACNTQGCKVDGGWSDWSAYTTCTRSCNSGTQTRTRTCTNPAPANGGKNCVGASSQKRVCNKHVPCPVHGRWSAWSDYTTCTKSCQSGTQSRTRTCTNPAPAHGGNDCNGASSQSRVCNNDVPCPVHGKWSAWSDYTTCTKSCKSGTQSRTRTCTNPAPAHGGNKCDGVLSQSQSRVCNNDVLCPVHGVWSDWSDYSACSKTCRAGTQSRTRTCTNPAPANGGNDCGGASSQSRACNKDVPCPVSVQFNSLNYNAVESDDVTLVIVRSGDLQQATTVFVSTSDYTAKKLTDYRPLKKLPVNFQSGQKLKKVVIDIINDKKVENSERFFAVLSPGSPSVQIVPAGEKANIRIDDDDSQFRFQKISYSVKENAGKVNLVILRSGSTNSKQTARVQTNDGSAVSSPNGDFQSVGNPTPLSVVFGAGEKRKRVSVNINDDKSVEQKEKFTVILSTNDARATVNDAFDVATVYILDNDVDGGWGKWSPWGACNKPCGYGKKYRTRKCDNPAPQGGGSPCKGQAKQSRRCYIKRFCSVYQPKTRPPYQPETRPPYQPETRPPYQPRTNPPNQPYYDQDEI